MSYPELLRRFISDEGAQDVVEYAFLAGFIGITGYVTLGALGGEVFAVYSTWIDPSVGVPSLWDPAPALVSS